MKKNDYVKIVAVNGDYRYGYIISILDQGFTLGISLFDEGESKIAYDMAYNALTGQESINYISLLTETEKRIVLLLSAGYNTNLIADKLSISPSTVRAHLRILRIKLHLDNTNQLRAFSPALASMLAEQNKKSYDNKTN